MVKTTTTTLPDKLEVGNMEQLYVYDVLNYHGKLLEEIRSKATTREMSIITAYLLATIAAQVPFSSISMAKMAAQFSEDLQRALAQVLSPEPGTLCFVNYARENFDEKERPDLDFYISQTTKEVS